MSPENKPQNPLELSKKEKRFLSTYPDHVISQLVETPDGGAKLNLYLGQNAYDKYKQAAVKQVAQNEGLTMDSQSAVQHLTIEALRLVRLLPGGHLLVKKGRQVVELLRV